MADSNSRAGHGYATSDILGFVELVHAKHDAGLQRAYDAPEAHGMPAIQLGPSEAKLLELLTRLIGAARAVEVGTLAGYSALRIARGLQPGGKLHTIELDPQHARIANDNLVAAGVRERVEIHVGRGTEVLPTLVAHGPFDLVFLDADKEGYPEYAIWAAANLRKGGLLIADNAYYFGGLLADERGAERMREFHRELPASFDSVCAPTPDGMVIGIRR